MTWSWFRGYPQILIEGDRSGIVYLIMGLFIIGLIGVFSRALKVSKAFNSLKEGTFVDGSKFLIKGAYIEDIATWLVTLGLIGNVVGFAIAMYGMDIHLSGAAGAQKAAFSLLSGMKVAFYTTLVGAVLALWLDVNRRILTTATLLFMKDSETQRMDQMFADAVGEAISE